MAAIASTPRTTMPTIHQVLEPTECSQCSPQQSSLHLQVEDLADARHSPCSPQFFSAQTSKNFKMEFSFHCCLGQSCDTYMYMCCCQFPGERTCRYNHSCSCFSIDQSLCHGMGRCVCSECAFCRCLGNCQHKGLGLWVLKLVSWVFLNKGY